MSRVQLVVFEIDGMEFGIDARMINGILRAKRCTIEKDPDMPQDMEGMIKVQGNISYIYNLRYKLKLKGRPIQEESKILIATANDMPVGCIVDEIKDIVYFDEDEIEQVSCGDTGVEICYVDGIGRVDERKIIILDSDRLLAEAGRQPVFSN